MKRDRLNLTNRSFVAPRGGNGSPPRRWASWWRSKHPVLRFVVLLIVYLGMWKGILWTEVAQRKVFDPHLRFYARLLGGTLRLLGEPGVHVSGQLVMSNRFSVSIVEGCDAIEPVGLFVAAVLASPVAWWPKVPGLLVGSLFLMIMNLVRIVILFYVGIHFSAETFRWAHEELSQVLFIVLVVSTWILWALWAVRRTTPPPQSSMESDAV